MAHRILPAIIRPCGWSPSRCFLFSSLLFSSPAPPPPPFLEPASFFFFLFLSSLPPFLFFSSHCILLWSRAQATSDAIFRRIAVYLVQPSRFARVEEFSIFSPIFTLDFSTEDLHPLFSGRRIFFWGIEGRISEEDLSTNKLNQITIKGR